ncbi:hypothetical protein M9458_056440, partial [Cirrhinus mrigala]
MATPPPGGPANMESIRRGSGGPVRFPGILPLPAVLFPHEAPLGRDALAHSWPWGLLKYTFPPVASLHRLFRREDPQRCSVGVVLSFLQENLEWRLSPSTLKVYVAAIAAYHDAVDGLFLRKHHLIVRFLRGARRLNPPRPHLIPSWDLSVVLLGLRRVPFEPLASVELKYVTKDCAPDRAHFNQEGGGPARLLCQPRLGYVPKVSTTPFRDQVVNLQALPPEEVDPALALLCPVRVLRTYVDRTRTFRCSEQLFVCFGGQQKGNAVSKQRLAHWVVDAITLAYQCQGEP